MTLYTLWIRDFFSRPDYEKHWSIVEHAHFYSWFLLICQLCYPILYILCGYKENQAFT